MGIRGPTPEPAKRVVARIAKRLEELRTAYNLEPKDVADYLQIKADTYIRYEGRTKLPIWHIAPICDFYGITPYQLLTGRHRQDSLDGSPPASKGKKTPYIRAVK